MKIPKYVFILLLVLVGFVVIRFVVIPWIEDAPARKIIHSFMDSQGMDIKPWTDEYKVFMGGIVLSEYPELTGEDSDFITNSDDLDKVLEYAWRHSFYAGRYKGQDEEPPLEEATIPDES